MALTFTLNGQPFDGTPDAYGVQWFATVTGWDGPPMTANLAARPGDHGAWRGPSYFDTRPMTMSGVARCPNVTEVRRAKDRLDQLVPIGVDIPLTSVDGRTSYPQLAGPLLKNAVNGQELAFSIPLESASPFKYGPTQLASIPMTAGSAGVGSQFYFPLHLFTPAGAELVTNEGTVSARPVVTYWGPCYGPYSTNSDLGLSEAFDLDLPTSSDFLIVDHDVGSVLLNGTISRRTTQIPGSSLWGIDAGSAQTISVGAASVTGGAHVDVTWAPTYL